MSRSLEDLETMTRQQIREIQERYQREVAPLIKILADIEALKPPTPIMIDFMALSEKQQEYWKERLKGYGVLSDETDQ